MNGNARADNSACALFRHRHASLCCRTTAVIPQASSKVPRLSQRTVGLCKSTPSCRTPRCAFRSGSRQPAPSCRSLISMLRGGMEATPPHSTRGLTRSTARQRSRRRWRPWLWKAVPPNSLQTSTFTVLRGALPIDPYPQILIPLSHILSKHEPSVWLFIGGDDTSDPNQ